MDKIYEPCVAFVMEKLGVSRKVAAGAVIVMSMVAVDKVGSMLYSLGSYTSAWINCSRKRAKKRRQWQEDMKRWSDTIARIKVDTNT